MTTTEEPCSCRCGPDGQEHLHTITPPPEFGPAYMDNPKAVGASAGWRWGYLPCGCRHDGYGGHEGYRR